MKAKMYFDGGCIPNPGTMQAAVVFTGDIQTEHLEPMSQGTNNLAEWASLIYGLNLAKFYKITDLEVYGDSQLVVNQVIGTFKVRNKDFLPFYEEALSIIKSFKNFKISHVRRNENLAGIFLEECQNKIDFR